MSKKGPSPITGQVRSLSQKRRNLLKERHPEHLCANCDSVIFDEETLCLHCETRRPDEGWSSLSDHDDPWVGEVINDRYLIASSLGQGASGMVYRAESLSISRQFAIKIISTDSGQVQAEQIIARLNREVEALSRLRNPHIVSFYEIFDLQGRHVAAIMDLIDGHTLEKLVKDGGPLGISRACSLLRQMANGLYEAHQAGMIHRDLKPENLMVERLPAGDDFVHILDFGIVHLTDDTSVSMTHGFIGTPLYASPEQAMAHSIDHRSDIYSLGAILFFMLTGKPPFVCNNVYNVLRMHVRERPPTLGEANPGQLFPQELEQLTARMLAKEPSDRPDDLSSVIDQLDHFTNSRTETPSNSWSSVDVGDSNPGRNHTPTTGLNSTFQKTLSGAAIPAAEPGFSLPGPASRLQATHSGEKTFAIRLTGQEPAEILLFGSDTESPRPVPVPTETSVESIAMSEEFLISGHQNGVISRVALATGKSRTLFQDVRRTPITAVAVDTENRCIIAGSSSGRVYMHHNQRPSSSDWSRIRSGTTVKAIAINRVADLIAIARQDNSVEIISLSNLRIPTGQFRTTAPIHSMAISPDNSLLAAALVDRSIALFQLPTGHEIFSLPASKIDILTVNFSEDCKPLAVCSMNEKLTVLDFEEIGQMVRSS